MKLIVLFVLTFVLTGRLHAQDVYSFTFNHVALSVKDVDRSADFYKNVLGLSEITNRSKLKDVRWFSIGEGKELHLIAILKDNVTVNKAVHLALTTSNFDQFVSALDKMKITYWDWPGNLNKFNIRADGIKQLFFQDLDGYWIEVNSVVAK